MEQSTQSGDLVFYPSKNSSMQKNRIGLWIGFLITVPVLAFQSGNLATSLSTPFFWVMSAIMLLICAVSDHYLRLKLDTRQALATVSESALRSPALSGKIKSLPWQDIAAVSVTRVQGQPYLQFELTEMSSLHAQRGFWGTLSGSKLTLPLNTLETAEQAQLLDAINQRVNRAQGRELAALPPNELAQENAFQQELKQLSPYPWVTYGLIAINVAVWIITVTAGGNFAHTPTDKLLAWGGNAASAVQDGEWWRLLTATFLHSGFMHVAMNMVGLYSAGVMLERIYGPRLFALIYFASGLVGSALSLSYAAQQAVSVGASGAVFGVTGALFVAMLQHRDKLPSSLGKQTLSGLGFFILYSLLQGLSHKGIDNAAHIGGLLCGSLLALILPERLDMDSFRRTQGKRTVIAVAIALAGTVGLALMAPAATLDQKRVFASDKLLQLTFQDFDDGMKALAQESENVQSGKISEREADERSRTVFAPRFRHIASSLAEVVLRPGDPRAALLADTQKATELLAESLEMESIYPAGSNTPQPANPERAKQIDIEFKRALENLKHSIAEAKATAAKP